MGISNESKKNKEALKEALEEAIKEIINTIEKGTIFTTQDITCVLSGNDKYKKIYEENKELFENDVTQYHESIGSLMLHKSKSGEYSIVKDESRGKVKGMNVNCKITESQAWIKK